MSLESIQGKAMLDILTQRTIISSSGWMEHWSLRADITARTGYDCDVARLHNAARWLRDRGYPLIATRGPVGYWKLAGVTNEEADEWDLTALQNHYEELVRHGRALYRAHLPVARQRTIERAIYAGAAIGKTAVEVRGDCEPILNGMP